MSDLSVTRRKLRDLLGQVPSVDRVIRTVRRTTEMVALERELARAGRIAATPTVEPFLRWSPPGHFYSPVPDFADAGLHRDDPYSLERDPAGVDIRGAEQLALFRKLASLGREAPLPETPGSGGRYGTDNPNYAVGDALMLRSMLRYLRPRRYLEVGSGYSTALALDVNDSYLGGAMQVTAIEPYPDLVDRVCRVGDVLEVVKAPVQSVPLERFGELAADDVLFIDSSHVLKTWSDVHFLYTRVLPNVAPGVYVHIHDIFWPFEYPRSWIENGRAWNEAYLLHAFLACNHEFEIVLWTHYLTVRHRQVIAEELPAMLANTGGSLWMRRLSD